MTGFGTARVQGDIVVVRATVRSVNHKALDLKLRLPPDLADQEMWMRRRVRTVAHRGSLRVSVAVEAEESVGMRVDAALVRARLAALQEVAVACGAEVRPDPQSILDAPGVLVRETGGRRLRQLRELSRSVLQSALANWDRSRRKEGQGIVKDLQAQLAAIEHHLDGLAGELPGALDLMRERVHGRVGELAADAAVDPQRLAQEVAVLASRADINEELQRLHGHLESARRCLAGEGAPEFGKRVDFLAQEMHREANTLLSKAQALGAGGLPVTRRGLRIREAIGKIREQAANLV